MGRGISKIITTLDENGIYDHSAIKIGMYRIKDGKKTDV